MTGKTHLALNTAVITSLCAEGTINLQNMGVNDIALMGGILLGAVLPDIDSPNSIIRHRIRRLVVPKGFRRAASRAAMSGASYDHRKNLTHWPSFWLATCSVLSACLVTFPMWSSLFAGLAVGTATHLFFDMFNPYGIMLLAPASHKKYRFAKIPTNSIGEMIFLALSILLTGYLLIFALKW